MFGDFKHEEKQRLLDMDDICQLENGTPIVACYNDREYQFGIYGKRHVIYQDCWTTQDDILVFSIEKCAIDDFSKILMCMNISLTLSLTRQAPFIKRIVSTAICGTS